MRTITLDEIDDAIRVMWDGSLSYTERSARVLDIKAECPAGCPADPYSQEYADFQMQLWKRLSGRATYEPAKTELANGLTVGGVKDNMFPYDQQSLSLVGSYMMGVAFIMKVLGNAPTRDVLEYGIGWAHTSMMMARTGVNVTAVDIEPMFVELLQHNAGKAGLGNITAHNGAFGDVPDESAKFDAVVFFECFHHCFDHIALVDLLKTKLRPGGRILLANESVSWPDSSFPYPWGLRLDGQSLWAIRTHGWMELGFQEGYIIGLFDRAGFDVIKHVCATAGDAGTIYEFTLRPSQ